MSENVPPIAQSKRANYLDEKVLEFSSELFQTPLFGYAITIISNLLYIYSWYNKNTLFALMTFIFLLYLIIKLVQIKLFGIKNNFESNEEVVKKKLFELQSQLSELFNKIISFEDTLTSLKLLMKLYIFMKIINFINDKFLLWVLLNIVLLYSQIENICPHFIFKARMAVKQSIQGVLGIVECLIPRYEDP